MAVLAQGRTLEGVGVGGTSADLSRLHLSEIYSRKERRQARAATDRLELDLVLGVLFLGVAHVDGGWIDEGQREAAAERGVYARARSRKEEENCPRIDQPFSNTDPSHALSKYHAHFVNEILQLMGAVE